MRRTVPLAVAVLATLAACAATPTSPSFGSAEQDIGTRPPRQWEPSAVKPGNLRIATFNVRNFPKDVLSSAVASDAGVDEAPPAPDGGARAPRTAPRSATETDEAMLVDLLDRLDFDVLAVQEINDTARFDGVLARLGARNGRAYRSVFSLAWDHPQHVGIVVRADRARIEAPAIHPEIATRPTLRAGLSARIVSAREHGVDFGMLVLHLASGDSGGRATLRAEQARFAAGVVAAQQAATGDEDFVVIGDLNTAKQDAELPALDAAFATGGTGLAHERCDLGCTSYYVKSAGNPLVQPAWIDHVYLASMQEVDRSVAVTAGAHCAERSCQPFESSNAESGTSYWGVSDHCPVYFEVRDEDRD